MSQSSETTSLAERILPALGYPDGHYSNTYYTAQCAPGIGVAAWDSGDVWFVHMFPWGDDNWSEMPLMISNKDGHSRYARHVICSAKKGFVGDYPHLECSIDTDLLTIKCLIEEGINQCRLLSK